MQKANQKNRPSKSACFWLIKKSVFVCIRLAEKINFPSKIAFFNNLAYFRFHENDKKREDILAAKNCKKKVFSTNPDVKWL